MPNALFKKLKNMYESEENRLDEELQQAITEPSERVMKLTNPEWFAEKEKEAELRSETLRLEKQKEYKAFHEWSEKEGYTFVEVLYRVLASLVCIGILLLLIKTVLALPPFGDVNNPYNNEVARRYIEKGLEETGAVNMVAGLILDYRAFDTFGESTVLFTAACAVVLILKLRPKKKGITKAMKEAEFNDRHYEPKNDVILQAAAKTLVPVLLLFGFYVVVNGHISPGGGFSGGAIMGAGLVLYLNAFGFEKTGRFFTFKTFQMVSLFSLLTYCGLKSYSFFMGANHYHTGIPLGNPGDILSAGLILPLNICVGLVVMCTMYAFYALFRKGGM